MNNWEPLEAELEKQKELIIKKEGKVNQVYGHIAPSEITAGIESIPNQDLTMSTATEEDVKQGKTFYSGSSTLRTGTAVFDMDIINAIFMTPFETTIYEGDVYYSIPQDITDIRKYCFYKNHNYVNITFSENITTIDEYAFFRTPNFSFTNFDELNNLTTIGVYAFSYSGMGNVDLGHLPPNLKTVGNYAFYYVDKEYQDFVIPSSLTNAGQYLFMSSKRVIQNSLDLSNCKLKTLSAYMFYNSAFNCNFEVSETVTSIGTYFNHNGCFKNITIPTTVGTVGSYSFGASETKAVSDFYLQTATFESETPPTINKQIFAKQNIENGFKIYVPDTAVETYKAVTNLSPYVDIICPISEKP